MCGNYAILGGKSGRSLVRPVAMELLVGEIVWCFVDLFDEIGDF